MAWFPAIYNCHPNVSQYVKGKLRLIGSVYVNETSEDPAIPVRIGFVFLLVDTITGHIIDSKWTALGAKIKLIFLVNR